MVSVDSDDPGRRRLGFTFRLAGGTGKLVLEDTRFFGWLGVERLELEVPGLELPVDLSAGPERFQRRRTRVRIASLRLEQRDLDRLVAARAPAAAEVGIDRVQVRVREGFLAAAARARDGAHAADLTARIHLIAGAGSGELRLVVTEARTYGFLPVPAPVAAHRLLVALTGAAAGSVRSAEGGREQARVRALGDIELSPLAAFLWHTLPASGWRLPDGSGAELVAARPGRGVIHITYGPGPAARSPGEGDAAAALHERFRDAEDRLRGGDADGALRAYRAELGARGAEQPFVVGRMLAITCAQPAYFVDAVELARTTLARQPESAAAHAALAAVAAAQGDWREAAARFRALAELAAADRDDDAAVAAALAGARLLRATDGEAAAALYERALEHAPGNPEAAEALADRYAADGRWHDLVRLIRQRLQLAQDRAEQSRDHARLAEILGQRLDDQVAARAELEQACALDPGNPAALESLAELHAELGDDEKSIAVLEQAAAVHRERSDRRGEARAHARAAARLAELGDADGAAARYGRALELAPADADALRGAATLADTRGRGDEALALRRRLVDQDGLRPAERAELELELGASLLARGDVDGARAALSRAAEHGGPSVEARARGLLADMYRAAGDLPAAAAELAAAIEVLTATDEPGAAARQAAARAALARAELLAQMDDEPGGHAELERAASLAEGDRPLLATIARQLLAAAGRTEDRAAQRRWVDVLLSCDPPAAERVDLLLARAQMAASGAQLEAALGDVDVALAANAGRRTEALELKAWILAAAGDIAGRAAALGERADAADAGAGRAAAAVDAAEAWLEAGDTARALAASARALDELGDAQGEVRRRALLALGESAWRRRSWAEAARAAGELAGLLGGETRALWQFRLGTALDHGGDTAGAIAALEAVSGGDAPGELRAQTWRALAELYQRTGDPVRAARAFESFAGDERAPAAAAARADAWFRAGEIHSRGDRGGEDAERCLEGALRLAPDHMPALDALERIKRAQGDWERVAVILGRKIAATARSPQRQKPLLDRLATLQHERLGRTDVARETYARALAIDPEYRPALRFQAQDAEAQGDLERAAALFDRLALDLRGDADPAEDQNALARERAEALRALERIQRAHEDFGALAQTLTRLAAVMVAAGDEREAARLMDEASALQGMSASRDAHLKVAQQIEASAPERRTADDRLALARSYQRLGRYRAAIHELAAAREEGKLDDDGAMLLFALHRECERKAGLAAALERGAHTVPRQFALRRLREALRLYEETLDDRVSAERVRQRLAGLEVIEPRKPVEVDESWVVGEEPRDTLRGMPAMAEPEPEQTGEPATGNRQQATEEAPAERPAEISEVTAVANEIAEVAAAVADADDAMEMTESQVVSIEDLVPPKPADDDDAMPLRDSMVVSIEDLAPGAMGVAEEERRMTAPKLHAITWDVSETESVAAPPVADPDTAEAERAAASIQKRARELAAAGSTLDEEMLADLTLLRAAARRSGRTDLLGEALVTASAVELDRAASAAMLREAAAIRRAHLGDTAGAIDALGRALAQAPDNEAIMAELDSALRETGDFPRLAAAYELHLQALAGAARAQALYELALIHRDVFHEQDEGARRLREAHAADPALREVWLPLAEWSFAAGDLAEARRLFELARDFTELGDSERLELLARLAEIAAREQAAATGLAHAEEELRRAAALEEAGQFDAAIAHAEEAAAAASEDRRPLEVLERLYQGTGDSDSLSETLGRLLLLTPEPSARARLWYRRARLYRDVLHRGAETYRCLKEAYANDPDDAEIAHDLRSIAMARGEWALAAELLYSEIASARDRREGGALHHELALIFDEKLLDAEQARINYEQALALDPDIPASPAPLARLYQLAGRHHDAMAMAELAAERARTPEERGRLLKFAAASAERAGQPGQASGLYSLATFSSEGADREEAEASLALLSADGQPAARGDLLALRLSETRDPEQRIDLLHQMLELATAAGDQDAIQRWAEALIQEDPEDAPAYLALKAQATQVADWNALALLYERRAAAADDGPERAARYYELGRLYQDRMTDLNAAVSAYQQALMADPDHPAALEALATIAFNRGDLQQARDLYHRMRPETTSLAGDQLAFRRGEIAEATGRMRDALDAYRSAARLAPGNRAALTALSRVAQNLGETTAAVEAARASLDLIAPEDLKGLTAARLQLAELSRRDGDLEGAIDNYVLVLAEDPRSLPALRALADLHRERGAHAEAADTYGQLAALAPTTTQRAELLHRQGEIYQEAGDADAASDCFLKAIDLLPTHVPTLRRLVAHYWAHGDAQALVEIAGDIARQNALEGSEATDLARMLLAAVLRGSRALAAESAAALRRAAEPAAGLARALVEVEGRPGQPEVSKLARAAADAVSLVPGLAIAEVTARLLSASPTSAVAVVLGTRE